MEQADFLSQSQQSQFAELCSALYERELHYLSWSGPDNPQFLKRRLASLPFYIKRAAHAILHVEAGPLELDIQNASWYCKQSSKPPAGVYTTSSQAMVINPALAKFLSRYAKLGLVLPVQQEQDKLISVFLDTIDRVDDGEQWGELAFHLNRFGWFNADGRALEGQLACVVKPSKRSMSAACCGHQWSAAGRKQPRTLSLREVLLAVTLNWPKFTSVNSLPRV